MESRGQKLSNASDAILQFKIKSVDKRLAWCGLSVQPGLHGKPRFWQSRRICAEDCLRRHGLCSTHAIAPNYMSVCAYLVWPNNASRGRKPNQVLIEAVFGLWRFFGTKAFVVVPSLDAVCWWSTRTGVWGWAKCWSYCSAKCLVEHGYASQSLNLLQCQASVGCQEYSKINMRLDTKRDAIISDPRALRDLLVHVWCLWRYICHVVSHPGDCSMLEHMAGSCWIQQPIDDSIISGHWDTCSPWLGQRVWMVGWTVGLPAGPMGFCWARQWIVMLNQCYRDGSRTLRFTPSTEMPSWVVGPSVGFTPGIIIARELS